MVITAILYLIISKGSDEELKNRLKRIKDVFEFMFVFFTSILLVYIFNPLKPKTINSETRLLFCLLGIILLITAKYEIFFNESSNLILFKKIQKLFGN